MGSGIQTNNPIIVGAFRNLLQHQAIFVLVLLAVMAVGWHVLRGAQLRNLANGDRNKEVPPCPEANARRLTRISFGLLWIFDGILQAQASMPLGMTTQVIEPSACVLRFMGSAPRERRRHDLEQPSRHCARLGRVDPGWSRHLAARCSARQLVTARRSCRALLGDSWSGSSARVSGACSPRVSAGPSGPRVRRCCTALPECSLPSQTGPGRARGSGGRCSPASDHSSWAWPCCRRGPAAGTGVGSYDRQASPERLPRCSARWPRHPSRACCRRGSRPFGSFDAAHGWAVNLFLVICLAALGLAFLSGRPRVLRFAVPAAIVALPGRLGARPGSRLSRWCRDRPEQHDPHGARLRSRVPCLRACCPCRIPGTDHLGN